MRALINGTKVGHATTSGFSIQTATQETSSKDTGGDWTEAVAGKNSWTSTVEFLFNLDDTIDAEARLTFEDLYDAQVARQPVAFKLSTGVTGDTEYSGNALITGLDPSFANDENATASCTFTGTGALNKAVIA